MDRAHYSAGTARSQTVKLADVIDNSSTVAEMDPEFAKVYLVELKELVEALDKGPQVLREKALANIEAGFRVLGL